MAGSHQRRASARREIIDTQRQSAEARWRWKIDSGNPHEGFENCVMELEVCKRNGHRFSPGRLARCRLAAARAVRAVRAPTRKARARRPDGPPPPRGRGV